MQGTQKPPANKRRSYSPRILCILGFVFTYLVGLAICAPQAAAATLSAPGGNVSDPVVREVDIARPAVVRIITTINGRLTVRFTSTVSQTFPVDGSSYPIEMSGSGAFISAHGDILTADHVVNPPRDQSLNDALYQYAAQDVADYINAHFQVSAPYSPNDAYSVLSSGSLPSTPSYGQASSQVFLSTSYAGDINATKIETVPAADHAIVDKIEAQSSLNANDEAIVHVSGMDNMASIQLGDSSQVAELDNLTIIGYPGLGDLSEAPTDLLTSSINKVYVSALKKTQAGNSVIQVGGNVEHGDSGGPALDDKGNIVGIVSFSYSGTGGDYGQTSFLQVSNNAEILIKSLGLSTAPGAFERYWIQAMNDYSSSDAGHWQKASQELQSLSHAYPNFQGIATFLSYAQNQATHEQAPSGLGSSGNAVLVIILVVVLLLILGFVFYMLFKRNARAVVVAPGSPQYPTGAYGAYPPQSNIYPQQSGVYPPTAAAYGTSGIYMQPVPGTQPAPGVQQPTPAGAMYPNYTSPAAYGELASQVPQTPQVAISAPPLLQPVQESEQNAAFPAPPAQTPWPVEHEPAQRPRTMWTPPTRRFDQAPISQSIQEPVAPSKPANGSLSDVMGKSVSYALPAEQAETLSARTLDVAPGETQLPSGDSWPPVERPTKTPANNEDRTVLDQSSARTFSVPRRPAEIVAPDGPEANTSNPYTKVAPCGHTNPSGVRFCRVCGQPVPPEASPANNGNGL